MTEILFKLLLLGHFLGDFYFQSTYMAKQKNESFKYLILHCLIYFLSLILVILPVFSWSVFMAVLIITLVHGAIDIAKFLLLKYNRSIQPANISLYFFDQFLHIVTVFIVIISMEQARQTITYLQALQSLIQNYSLNMNQVVSWGLILFLINLPASITIRNILLPYRPNLTDEDEGHPNAGALIGRLERLIVLIFLSVGQYAAIGFILTAKSIARYNKIVETPQFSEYFLLGTLLSTLFVLVSYLFIF